MCFQDLGIPFLKTKKDVKVEKIWLGEGRDQSEGWERERVMEQICSKYIGHRHKISE